MTEIERLLLRCRDLEHELAAANKRIKKLLVKIDKLQGNKKNLTRHDYEEEYFKYINADLQNIKGWPEDGHNIARN
jgi:polyphosphate kinase 2 (PPK2 family)